MTEVTLHDLSEILATKCVELAGRAELIKRALETNHHDSVPFFAYMTRESARAVEFWLSHLEKSMSEDGKDA